MCVYDVKPSVVQEGAQVRWCEFWSVTQDCPSSHTRKTFACPSPQKNNFVALLPLVFHTSVPSSVMSLVLPPQLEGWYRIATCYPSTNPMHGMRRATPYWDRPVGSSGSIPVGWKDRSMHGCFDRSSVGFIDDGTKRAIALEHGEPGLYYSKATNAVSSILDAGTFTADFQVGSGEHQVVAKVLCQWLTGQTLQLGFWRMPTWSNVCRTTQVLYFLALGYSAAPTALTYSSRWDYRLIRSSFRRSRGIR